MDSYIQEIIIGLICLLLLIGYIRSYMKYPNDFRSSYKRSIKSTTVADIG